MKPELKIKLPDWAIKAKQKIHSSIKGVDLSDRQKKIISTVFVAAMVCGFYLWIGIGLGRYMPADSRGGLSSLLVMYAIFPMFVLFFSVKRIINILLGKEDREVIEPINAAAAKSTEPQEREKAVK